jgi:DNA excision repair protein ERCC-4
MDLSVRPNRAFKKYQQDLFAEVRTQDELVILAQGLGLLHIITNLLHGYDAAGNNLVLVVGANDQENEWIGEGLRLQNLPPNMSLF